MDGENKRISFEEQYQSLIMNAPGAILVMQDGKYIFANPAGAETLGYDSPEDLEGIAVIDTIAPEFRNHICRRIDNLETGRRNTPLEMKVFRRDGSVLWMESTSIPISYNNRPAGLIMGIDITERKKAEEAYRTSEKEKSFILDTMKELYAYYTTDLEIIWVNRAAADLVGLNREALVGRRCYTIWHRRATPCPSCPALKAIAERRVQEAEITTPDGKEWLMRGFPVFSEEGSIIGAIEFAQDITAQKRTERELRNNEDTLRIIFNNVKDAIYIHSIGGEGLPGKILEVNQVAIDMFGYNREEFLKLTILQLIADELRDQLPELMHELIESNSLTSDSIYVTKEGKPFPVEVSSQVLLMDGNRCVLSVVRDLSERKQALERIKRELKEKEILLKEIHHRVKNNLNIVSSLLSLQADQIETKQEAKDALLSSRNRVFSMALVHERLYQSKTLAHIEMEYYIKSLVEDLVKLYMKNLTLDVDIDIDDITMDITRAVPCGLIINELVTNALIHAFTDLHTGTLAISLKRGSGERNEHYALVVRDSGKGLPKGFLQEEKKSLGFQLVTVLAEQLGGTIAFDGSGGTEVILTFPAPPRSPGKQARSIRSP